MENKSYEKVEIILNEKISEGIYKMDVKGEFKTDRDRKSACRERV